MKNDELIKLIEKKCNKKGIDIELRDTKYVINGNQRCLGYFDIHSSKIVVAKNSEENYIGTLVHEYCHFLQYLDNKKDFLRKIVSITTIIKWINGSEQKNIKKHIDIIKDLELDNEIRTVDVLKKYKTSVDINHYIKSANSAILSFNLLKKNRKWNYRMIEEWRDKMPSKLNIKYKKYKKLFIA
jgi:hypothetical protein